MSNILNTIASRILSSDRDTARRLLSENPLAGFVYITYTYTQEYGSDGCWDKTEKSACFLSEWISSGFMLRHPGNRSYNFAVCNVEDTDLATAQQRRDEKDRKEAAHMEAARQFAAAQRAEAAKAVQQLESAKARFAGKSVTSKKVSGKVERVIRSKFGTNIVALVSGKWVDIKTLALV